MEFENVILGKEGNIGIVKLNRPDKLNALNLRTLDELNKIFKMIEEDSSIMVVILTGAGDKAFVAGADITEINKLSRQEAEKFSRNGQEIFSRIENFDKPVIAAVNGYALGGGCELAMACHIRIASENARFGQPEINLGIIPGYGGTVRLREIAGKSKALEMILTGDMIDADEAYRIGLVNKVTPHGELLDTAIKTGEKIASKSGVIIKYALESLRVKERREEMENESRLFALCTETEDFKEGTSAFLEKRKAQFMNK
ncbi:enoyl-CoA hydratase/isomerase family protein [Melioribacter sp. Ez-97]|uniref:enoyl-CoA hydratase/isomerase family protein n=1 Tax=Melioribacter sp. Ez-97 TaxID=3423434 RepID=UPI003EDAE3F1